MSIICWRNGEPCVLRSFHSTCSSFLMTCQVANISWSRHILFNICLIRGQEKGVDIATYRLTAALSYLGFVLLGTNTARFYGVDNANCKHLCPLRSPLYRKCRAAQLLYPEDDLNPFMQWHIDNNVSTRGRTRNEVGSGEQDNRIRHAARQVRDELK